MSQLSRVYEFLKANPLTKFQVKEIIQDFKHYIDLVANYYQSGRLYTENWNK